MIATTRKPRIWALLLVLAFLAAQFHFCADLGTGRNGSHMCAYCLNSVSDVAPHSPLIGTVLAMIRLEVSLKSAPASAGVSLAVSPRAPPSA